MKIIIIMSSNLNIVKILKLKNFKFVTRGGGVSVVFGMIVIPNTFFCNVTSLAYRG